MQKEINMYTYAECNKKFWKAHDQIIDSFPITET